VAFPGVGRCAMSIAEALCHRSRPLTPPPDRGYNCTVPSIKPLTTALTPPTETRMKVFLCRLISYLLVFSLAGLPFTTQATLIGTDVVVKQAQSQSDRDRVRDLVARADVQQALQAYGVNPQMAKERVDALTDMEVQEMAGKLDTLPAGASGTGETVVIAVLLVIIIYVILRYVYK
jgi:predicted PurR-regulated permease PerM